MSQVQIDSKFADKQGEIMVVELGGHIDQSNSDQLQKMFDNIIHSGCFKVIVDFGKLYYMSSAGWGVFIGEIKRFRDNGGDIKLANMNSDIYDVFQMLEFFHILEDFTSVKEAALSFKSIDDEINLVNNFHGIYENTKPDEIDATIDELEFDENGNGKIDSNTTALELGKKHTEIIDFVPNVARNANTKIDRKGDFSSLVTEQNIKLSELPIFEKVKKVVAQNPLIGAWGIRKILRHEHFGYTRISIFKLRRLLKELDLNTKKKRFRYFRSC